MRRRPSKHTSTDRLTELAAILAGALLPLLLSARRVAPQLPSSELELAHDRPLSVAPGRFEPGDVESGQ